jgi:alginate O-acetyltransferase complex protein AlgI
MFLFLPIVLLFYWLLGKEIRNYFLLLVSFFYYAWGGGEYLALIVLSIGVNYLFGLLIGFFRKPFSCIVMDFHAKVILCISIIVNLGILFYPKHVTKLLIGHYFANRLQEIPTHSPIGVSFFTFGAMAYVFDIYLQKNKAQKNPIDFGLFMALFPKLTAGPIVRYSDIEGDLANPSASFENIIYGVKRFIIGLGKKILIADTLAKTVQQIMAIPPEHLTTRLAYLGIVSYTLQIYLDFSGYSDMAIGLGRMFGFHFLENFNYPYISKSITEFWRRWHISLSSWFRDYLYIPLGGNRRSPSRTYLNLFTVFLLCGLWHGRHWNFILWGVFHGSFLMLERWKLGKILKNTPPVFQHSYALLIIVFSWVLFRIDSVRSAIVFFKILLGSAPGKGLQYYHLAMYVNSELLLALAIGILCSTPISQVVKQYAENILDKYNASFAKQISYALSVTEVSALVAVFLLSLISLASFTYNPFIYFKF